SFECCSKQFAQRRLVIDEQDLHRAFSPLHGRSCRSATSSNIFIPLSVAPTGIDPFRDENLHTSTRTCKTPYPFSDRASPLGRTAAEAGTARTSDRRDRHAGPP